MWAPTDNLFTATALGAALLASLTGSLHCLGMCGPLRLLGGSHSAARVQYQLGRMLAYLALGGLAGFVGSRMPWWAWIPFLALAALFTLANAPIFPAWKTLRGQWIAAASAQPGLLGLASGLLPCGLLHAWILVAAATVNPLHGAALLFMLWLGTLPALEIGSFALQRPMQTLRRRFPRSFPLFFLALALLPILLRQGVSFPEVASPPAHCHTEH